MAGTLGQGGKDRETNWLTTRYGVYELYSFHHCVLLLRIHREVDYGKPEQSQSIPFGMCPFKTQLQHQSLSLNKSMPYDRCWNLTNPRNS